MFLLTLLLACDPAADTASDQPADNFGDHRSVRITSPGPGDTVHNPVVLRFSAGEQVDQVRAFEGEQSLGRPVDASAGRLELELAPGSHDLVLRGFGGGGAMLAEDSLRVRVLETEPEEPAHWVGILTPSAGSHPVNPVTLVAQGSDSVETVAFYAGDWLLAEGEPGQVFTYSFGGLGQREIELRGLDSDGAVLATDTLTVTVEQGADPGPETFSELIEDLVLSYPMDGTYEYYWPQSGSWSGSTRDIWYQGELIASGGGHQACYCSGITFEWYMLAFQDWDLANGGDGQDLNGISASEIWDFRRDWYVRDLDGPGPSFALENYGLGVQVDSTDSWVPGDFVQLWRRNGTGHTAVFMGWITDSAGNRVGMDYASCQGSTDGLGIHSETFGAESNSIDPLLIYAARPWLPADWY